MATMTATVVILMMTDDLLNIYMGGGFQMYIKIHT